MDVLKFLFKITRALTIFLNFNFCYSYRLFLRGWGGVAALRDDWENIGESCGKVLDEAFEKAFWGKRLKKHLGKQLRKQLGKEFEKAGEKALGKAFEKALGKAFGNALGKAI